MRRLARGSAALFLACAALIPASAWACPFCFSGSPKVRMAFFGTTVLLSLLPLGMISAGVVWIRRVGRGMWAEEFDDSDPVP